MHGVAPTLHFSQSAITLGTQVNAGVPHYPGSQTVHRF